MDEKVIKKLLVCFGENMHIVDDKDGEIEEFWVNGEMAMVRWFRQGENEWNGKYVINIEYKVI